MLMVCGLLLTLPFNPIAYCILIPTYILINNSATCEGPARQTPRTRGLTPTFSARDNASQIEFNIHRADVRFTEFIARTSDPSHAYKRPSTAQGCTWNNSSAHSWMSTPGRQSQKYSAPCSSNRKIKKCRSWPPGVAKGRWFLQKPSLREMKNFSQSFVKE